MYIVDYEYVDLFLYQIGAILDLIVKAKSSSQYDQKSKRISTTLFR